MEDSGMTDEEARIEWENEMAAAYEAEHRAWTIATVVLLVLGVALVIFMIVSSFA